MRLAAMLYGFVIGINASTSLETGPSFDTFDFSGLDSPRNPYIDSIQGRGASPPPSGLSFSSSSIQLDISVEALRSSGDSLTAQNSLFVDEVDFASRLQDHQGRMAIKRHKASKERLSNKRHPRLEGSPKKEGS
ncbi:hypothetical protein PSACC_02350 [Paramicrosporidium saccamoebae]|uniref:Uncharacterized protein n=1 Tax=Paramicrosporidium saccamoebae TaxID=1246581 RepID=A0A2H9TJA2_9FUNG|nr:hypothetical protein PSACC_02350 [Paramicrosporidium saccamoebae]